MKLDSVYTEQMLDSVRKIESFMTGIGYVAFLKDEKTQSAVIMQLALIGELAKRLSTEGKSSIGLPWKEIAGFRDRAIHDYFDVDLDIVWNTVQTDIPTLKKELLGATRP